MAGLSVPLHLFRKYLVLKEAYMSRKSPRINISRVILKRETSMDRDGCTDLLFASGPVVAPYRIKVWLVSLYVLEPIRICMYGHNIYAMLYRWTFSKRHGFHYRTKWMEHELLTDCSSLCLVRRVREGTWKIRGWWRLIVVTKVPCKRIFIFGVTYWLTRLTHMPINDCWTTSNAIFYYHYHFFCSRRNRDLTPATILFFDGCFGLRSHTRLFICS